MNKSNNKIRELNSTKSLTDVSTKISSPNHLEGWPLSAQVKEGGL